MKMKNYESNIYLYAKHWYKRHNIINDLAIIYSHRNGIDMVDIDESVIAGNILTLIYNHINCERDFCKFVDEVAPSNWYFRKMYKDEEYTYEKAIIYYCLSILSITKLSDIKNGLDRPDNTILPIADHITKEKINNFWK